MLNQVVLVGRLTSEIEIKKEEKGEVAILTLAVPRSLKNADGEYETDFIECALWNSIATNASEYCHKGDIVGIKGRLQTNKVEKDNGELQYKTIVIAERVSFLSSKSKESE